MSAGRRCSRRRRATTPAWPRSATRPPTRTSSPRSAPAAASPPSCASAWPRRRSRCRRVPRRGRGLPQPGHRDHVPAPRVDRPREGHRPAVRREPAPAGRLLSRDDASRRDAGGRGPAPGSPAHLQRPDGPRRRMADRPRLRRPDRGRGPPHRPGRAGLARCPAGGLPAGARDGPGRGLRRDRRGEPADRRDHGGRDRGRDLRGGRRARLRRGRPRDRWPRGRPGGPPRAAEPGGGAARLRDRRPRLQADRRRPARRRRWTTPPWTAGSCGW